MKLGVDGQSDINFCPSELGEKPNRLLNQHKAARTGSNRPARTLHSAS